MATRASESNEASSMDRSEEKSAPVSDEISSLWQREWRLLGFAVQVDPAGFWTAVITAWAASIAEGTGIVLLLPLLAIAGMNLGSATTAGRLGAMVQTLLLRSGMPHSLWLPVVLGVFLLVAGLRSVLIRSQSMMVYATTTKVQLALSKRVYASVVKAQWEFLIRQRSGRMTHLLTAELYRVSEAMNLSLSLINLGCLILLYLVIALKLSASMTLLVLVIGAALLMLQRRSLDRVRKSSEVLNESIGEVYVATEEHLLNMKSVKTYNAEDRNIEFFSALCDNVSHHTVDNARLYAASTFRFEMGSLLALGGVIFMALGVLHVQAAAMLLLLAVFTRLMPQLASLQSQMHQLAGALPSFEHVLTVEAECLRNVEPPSPDLGSSYEPMALKSELRLEDIWFAYQVNNTSNEAIPSTDQEFVLRGIDLHIKAGSLTALVGPSGSGKSTIADLITGLLQPARGRMLLDDREMTPATMRQWRSQIGYVGQDTVLFHQSVRDNLLWAKPDADEEELHKALMLASADFVFDLPRGLESIVGDRGILLSSGQRQRISIARALLRKPSLLILDEATNALDVENEACVLDALLTIARNQQQPGDPQFSVLMIAHRASAIRRADTVIELDGGRVMRTQMPPLVDSEAR
jgi:ATP-binding cassette subfamily C protein